MPRSQQRKRHKDPVDPEEAVTALLQELVSKRPGTSCETEMAGDWNSLGIALAVPGDYGAREILELGNALVRLMGSAKA